MAALGFLAYWNVTRGKLRFVLIKSYSLFYVLGLFRVMSKYILKTFNYQLQAVKLKAY